MSMATATEKSCDYGMYGLYCNNTCNCNCLNNVTCNSMTGECPPECPKGKSFIFIATLSATGVLLTIALFTFVCLAVKKSRKRKTSDDRQDMWCQETQHVGSVLSYSNSVLNEDSEEPKETIYRIHVSDLENYIVQGRKKNTLKQEFELIVRNSVSCYVCSVGGAKENERKNRYSTILPYDHTRVILEKLPNDPYSDYINASYIDGYKRPKKYIAAQGPKPLRMADFWRMVWQEGSCKIVMVTNLIEGGETKCKKYWPKKTDHYGSLKIQMLESEVSVDFTIRTFILSKSGNVRTVKQFQFTTWQEMKTPLYTKSLLTFIGKFRDYEPLHQSPIVVHSSAGTGRTGAFILLDYMLDMVQWEKRVDFVKCVCDMRQQRMNMVETAEQYVFIYETLLDALWPYKTSIHCYRFKVQIKELTYIDPESGCTCMEEEFERISRLYPSSQNDSNQTEPSCWINDVGTNQTQEPLSPILLSTFTEEVPSKRHPLTFVHVDGYRKRKAFLVTTFPNANQFKEFWSKIYHSNTLTIVLLNDLHSIAEKGFPRYWPREGSTINFGEFTMEYIGKECEKDDIVTRNFKLTDNNESKLYKEKPIARMVKHFHLINWKPTRKVPPSPMLLVDLISKVEKWQQETPKHSLVVQCLDGIRASGLFCACFFLCDKIKLEQEVDVYLAVRTIRSNCSKAIEDVEQYSYCYTFAGSFLEKHRDYANFS